MLHVSPMLMLHVSPMLMLHVSLERARNMHIKTHLWDLSTNLSKLNIFLKLKNVVLYES